MMRPTPGAAALFALSIPLALLLTTLSPAHWYAALYYPCILLTLMLGDLGMALPQRLLTVGPTAPGRLYIGEQGLVTLRLEAPGWKGRASVTALVELEGEAETPPAATGDVAGGEALEIAVPVRPTRRGVLVVAAVWLRWRGRLGLMERRVRRPADLRIEVAPNIRGIHEEAIRFFARDSVPGLHSQRLRGDGVEFDALREYAPGMDNRFIDWKRSARHRKLLCKDFRRERNNQVILGFDTGHLMLEPVDGAPRLDHVIRAGLQLGWASLRDGDFVGGCGFDACFRGFVQPGRGMPYFRQIQRFAAGLEYRPEETNFTLGLSELNARLKRRGLIVLFSEFVDSISAELLLESMQALVRRHLVVFVTLRDPMLRTLAESAPGDFRRAARAVFAGEFLRERAVVLEKVARLGVHCLDVPAAEAAGAVLGRYLHIKQRGLL